MEETETLQEELKRSKVKEDELQREVGSLKEEIRDLKVEIEDLKGDIVYLVKTQKDGAHRVKQAELRARKVKQMIGNRGMELEDVGRCSRRLSSLPQSAQRHEVIVRSRRSRSC
jgi:chromosome segregation ATPase